VWKYRKVLEDLMETLWIGFVVKPGGEEALEDIIAFIIEHSNCRRVVIADSYESPEMPLLPQCLAPMPAP